MSTVFLALIYSIICMAGYLWRYERSASENKDSWKSFTKCGLFEKGIDYIAETLEKGNGIILFEIRDIINEKHDQIFLSNKVILGEIFRRGNTILPFSAEN